MKPVFALLLLLLALTSPVLGQQAAKATLTGTVTDPNRAVIAGAAVTATQTATAIRRTTVSNDEGVYVLTDLAPGEYEVKVEASGFTALRVTNLVLQVGQSITIDAPLRVQGAIEELYADPPLINYNDSLVQSVVDTREVERLPLDRIGLRFLSDWFRLRLS